MQLLAQQKVAGSNPVLPSTGESRAISSLSLGKPVHRKRWAGEEILYGIHSAVCRVGPGGSHVRKELQNMLYKLYALWLQLPWERLPVQPTPAVGPKVRTDRMMWYTSGFT